VVGLDALFEPLVNLKADEVLYDVLIVGLGLAVAVALECWLLVTVVVVFQELVLLLAVLVAQFFVVTMELVNFAVLMPEEMMVHGIPVI